MNINIAMSVDGEYIINDKIIEDKVFDEQLVDYRFEERENEIDNLIQWASEAKDEYEKFLIKADLKQLMNLNEKYVLSSVTTNEYISQEEDMERFRKICLEILEVNGKNPRRTNDLNKPLSIR